MLPKKIPKKNETGEIIDLGRTVEEIPEVQQDQFHSQLEVIQARNKRIMDKAAGIVAPPEPIEQMPVNKDTLKQKKPGISNDWNPYDK